MPTRTRASTLPRAAAVQDKVSYLRSQAQMELTSAQQRLEQVHAQADAARQAFHLHLEAAAE